MSVANEREILRQVATEVSDQPNVPDVAEVLKDVRVIFADESDATTDIFKQVVARLKWNALYVNNAVEMMDAVNNLLSEGLGLDGVVADIAFLSGPRITGVTAVREIRKVLPDVPVIFISEYVTSIIREEVRRIGAELLQKPFDVEALFVRLSQLIYWSRLTTTDRGYTGKERRAVSINRTHHHRRVTDYVLSTPDRISKSIDLVSKQERDK